MIPGILGLDHSLSTITIVGGENLEKSGDMSEPAILNWDH